MSVYQVDDGMKPDSEFEPGEFRHLVIGNRGRLLDPRRTPVAITDLLPDSGMFVLQVQAFEDEGATWEIPFEDVPHFQFARGGPVASDSSLRAIGDAVDRFERPLIVPSDPSARLEAHARIDALAREVGIWMDHHGQFTWSGEDMPDPTSRSGSPDLMSDLERYLSEFDLLDMEQAFTRQFVSNPDAGETVKGHRIVIAELGLAAYEGKVVRNADLFSDRWCRERRANHVMRRMAFVRAMFGRMDRLRIRLYRGMALKPSQQNSKSPSFVSATFSLDVALSHVESAGESTVGVLYRQHIPVERVLMTFYETRAMNRQYREAEALLLFDPETAGF